MWWKSLSVVILLYVILAGFLVPLKSGITDVDPAYHIGAGTQRLTLHGYNTFFTKENSKDIRIWMSLDADHALFADSVVILNDTMLQATVQLPGQLPKGNQNAFLTAIVDLPVGGTCILPAAISLKADTSAVIRTTDTLLWQQTPVQALHVQKGFSFPYQNVIYETIRNTYFHVPMWFVLMFLFMASVVYSVAFLFTGKADYDRKAEGYAETGLLFGFLGLFTGMVWANYAWGKPWSNDIKQLMTAVALLVYLAYFILRHSFDEPQKSARLAAVYNIFAFASLVPLLYIVPRMFASLHPGATGNPAFGAQDLDNTMRAVFYPAIIGWTLLGFWIADLRIRTRRLIDKSQGLD